MNRARTSTLVAVAAALLVPLFGAGAASATPHYETAPSVQTGFTDSATPRKSYGMDIDHDGHLGTWRDNKGLTHTSRVYATFDLSPFVGRHIVSAKVGVQESSATDCTKRAIEVWETDPVTTMPTWRNAPAPRRLLDEMHTVSFCPGTLQFDVTEAVHDQGGLVTFVLRVPEALEKDRTYGRTLDGYRSIGLTIDSNTTPVLPVEYRYQGGFACDDTAPPRTLGTFPGVLQALAVDPDDNQSDYEFAVWPQDDPTARLTLTDNAPDVNAGTVALPAGYLTDGRTYSWQARATDGVDTSDWTPPCSFRADTVRPTAPTASATPDAVFTFDGGGNTDVAAFQYTWQEFGVSGCSLGQYSLYHCAEPLTGDNVVRPNVPGGSVTVSLTPPNPGFNLLRVRSLDAAGQSSPEVRLEFPPDE